MKTNRQRIEIQAEFFEGDSNWVIHFKQTWLVERNQNSLEYKDGYRNKILY